MLYHGNPHGVCRRAPPVSGEFSEVSGGSVCGEWADKNITNEQAEQRELVRRFALALVTAGYQDKVHKIWQRAAEFADYEGQVMAGFTTTTTTYKSKD
ncbi:hypothetical protein LBMAG46_42280 [Planctomycetia bacterium]|nr:hypothetical protein LBMAG46_42280 [Planctomycetia bacterium]